MIAIGSDNALFLSGLQDSLTSSYLNSAVVTWQLTDSSNTVLGSGSLSYVSASNGDYQGNMPNSLTSTLVVGQRYFLTWTATYSGFQFQDQQLHAALYVST